ncbi:hypothetical protein MNBD_NITROSPINAE01-876 [hydrothermal vent metagenome]|uniref:Uncharacterized protein n=1 Tax=hydrothermal vent metagenome TaxID=652676 RepID=A0A3B1BVE6_9ZZZZ
MGRYKKVIKKKEKGSGDLLLDSGENAKHWIVEHFSIVSLAVGALILAGALWYGMIYYNSVTYQDAQGRLYEATMVTRAASLGGEDPQTAVSKAREIVERGGPSEVVAQELIALAGLLFKTGDYTGASLEFERAAGVAENGTLHHERALIGKAHSAMAAGKIPEAEAQFKALAQSVKFYPKADILLNLAFALAGAGKTDEAVKMLNQIKADNPSFYSEDFIADTIHRIEDGGFAPLLKLAATIKDEAPDNSIVAVHGEGAK